LVLAAAAVTARSKITTVDKLVLADELRRMAGISSSLGGGKRRAQFLSGEPELRWKGSLARKLALFPQSIAHCAH